MKKRLYYVLILTILLAFEVNWTDVSADTGPKPSVEIEFDGYDNHPFYVTLLSKDTASGPWDTSCVFGNYSGEEQTVHNKFVDYKDKDGYYYIGYLQKCSNDQKFDWSYFAPDNFKILIYDLEQDRYMVSQQSYEAYAFASYYTVHLDYDSMDLQCKMGFVAVKEYHFSEELVALIARILITIVIEVIIAYFFGYRNRNQIGYIIVVNVFTQVLLNVVLNYAILHNTTNGIYICYGILELTVFLVEGVLYQRKFDIAEKRTRRPIIYAVVANVFSLILGIVIALFFPVIA